VQDAARRCGVSEGLVYRRLRDPAFKSRVTRARADLVERAAGGQAAGMTRAADTLAALLEAPVQVRVSWPNLYP
jgi:hypothetical protein